VTGFPSWNGIVDPGTAFGPEYASELGRRFSFGLAIEGDGATRFSISQLSFKGVTDDPTHMLDFHFAAGSYGYSSEYRGLDYGPDRMRGTADDVWITSGVNTQLVDAIYGRRSGNGIAAYCPGCTAVEQRHSAIQPVLQAAAANAP
jgi:hypothetical protein